MRRLQPNKGFTLMETVIVISIVTVMTGTSVFILQPFQSQKPAQLFFKALEQDLLYAQQYAISNKKTIVLLFDPGNHRYIGTEGGISPKRLYTVSYDSDILLTPSTMEARVQFTPDGRLSDSGTIVVQYRKKRYNMIFYMGMGRMGVEER